MKILLKNRETLLTRSLYISLYLSESMTWQQNPMELVAFAGLYVSGFAAIKYARR